MKYTVVWHSVASDALGKLWLNASDRASVARAAHQIDKTLKHSPRSHARPVGDGLGLIVVPPLKAMFAVIDDDRIVQVVELELCEQEA